MRKKYTTAVIQWLTYDCEQATRQISLAHEQQLTTTQQLKLYAHRLMCRQCEQFYQNDKKLSEMIEQYKQK